MSCAINVIVHGVSGGGGSWGRRELEWERENWRERGREKSGRGRVEGREWEGREGEMGRGVGGERGGVGEGEKESTRGRVTDPAVRSLVSLRGSSVSWLPSQQTGRKVGGEGRKEG